MNEAMPYGNKPTTQKHNDDDIDHKNKLTELVLNLWNLNTHCKCDFNWNPEINILCNMYPLRFVQVLIFAYNLMLILFENTNALGNYLHSFIVISFLEGSVIWADEVIFHITWDTTLS